MVSLLEVALYYASIGWQVFPLQPRSKEPFSKEILNLHGDGGLKVATSDREVIGDWWARWPSANIGIACGVKSGLIVLDVDSAHGGNESILALIAEHGHFPNTPETMTGGGGRHICFSYPGVEIHNSAGKLGPGLDIRGDGGYIVAPTSIHPN